MAKPTYSDDSPTFNGQAIFGQLSAFSCQQITWQAGGSAAAIDTFLGRSVGTTAYGAGSGMLWGLSGALVANSSAGVSALEATLLSFAGQIATLGLPTGLYFPADFQYRPNCYFSASDFAPTPPGIVSIGGGMYSLSYSIVFRELH